MTTQMTVSQLAKRVGTSSDTIRYYERIGLLPEVDRTASGYRLFGEDHADRVAFIKRAQSFGLQLEDISGLLDIRDNGLCPCGHARRLLAEKLAQVDEQLQSLAVLREDITTLLASDDHEDSDGSLWAGADELLQLRPPGTARPRLQGITT